MKRLLKIKTFLHIYDHVAENGGVPVLKEVKGLIENEINEL